MKNIYLERIAKLRALLKPANLDAIFVLGRKNTVYLTGFKCSYSIMIVDRRKARFYTDSRYAEMAETSMEGIPVEIVPALKRAEFFNQILAKSGYKTVGFEGQITVDELDGLRTYAGKGIKLEKAGHLIDNLRRVKDEAELKYIRRAVDLADRLMGEAFALVKPGVKEIDISRRVKFLAEELGGEGESFENIIASGPNSSRPHHHPGTRAIRVGDPVTIDLGVIYGGYCSDLTRNPVLGKVSKKFETIYNLVLEANLAAIDAVKPGMTGVEVDSVAREVIAKAGYGEYFGHGLGHGVGLDIHESPRLSQGAGDYKLEVGNIITIEPGIYIPKFGGVRIEDYVLLTEKGAKVLSKYPKELTVLK